jgi:hypothetical protein
MCARFLKGDTATDILKVYRRRLKNPDLTRNMILGVLARGGVLGQGRSAAPSRVSPARIKQGALRLRNRDGETVAEPLQGVPTGTSTFGRSGQGDRKAGQAIPIRPITPTAKPIAALVAGECKFPVGHPEPGCEQLFCGAVTPLDRPTYCADHARFMYEPATAGNAKPADPLRRRR